MTAPADADATAGFLAVLTDLADFLSAEVMLDQIATHVGAWAPGQPSETETLVPAELRASSRHVDRASVARFPESDIAYAVTVVPIEGARPSVAAMRTAFGEPRVGTTGPDMPIEVQFAPAVSGGDWRIVILARGLRHGPDLNEAVLTHFLLRRDRVT